MAKQQMESWDTARSKYVLELDGYRTWFGILASKYFSSCSGKVTRDGLTGAIVGRARFDVGNLIQWMDGPIFLLAYCTRSLLELATASWSIEETGDWSRWYGLMAKDLIDIVGRTSAIDSDGGEEVASTIQAFKADFGKSGIPVADHTQSFHEEAKNGHYTREYEEVFQLLSKYVHPTPVTLVGPEQLVDSAIVRRFFLVKSVRYLRTIYCLAAKQSGYNPAQLDLDKQLSELRSELDPTNDQDRHEGGAIV
jgi:hypothetical protein